MLEDLCLMVVDGGIVFCMLLGGLCGYYDGYLCVVYDGVGNLLVFILSIFELVLVDGGGCWELVLDSVGYSLWDWDIFSDWVVCMLVLVDEMVIEMLLCVYSEDIDQVCVVFDEYLCGCSEQYSVQFCFWQVDGQWCWVLDCGCVVVCIVDGQLLCMVGMYIDIEQQKQFELLLQEQQLYLSEV